MTPAELRAEAAHLTEHLRRVAETIRALRRAADALEAQAAAALTAAKSAANLPSVTHAELARRGRQIAKGRGEKTKDQLWKAILASKWVSRERYAAHIGTGGNNLHRWMTGGATIPRPMADKIRRDFPAIDDAYWQTVPRKGVAE